MTRSSSGTVSHAVCVRTPMAKPAANAASTTSRPVAASSDGGTSRPRQPRWRTNAVASSAWTPRAATRPGASLNGRATVTNASGQLIARRPAASAVSASPVTARASGCSATTSSAPAIIASSDSAAVSTGTLVQGAGTSHDRPASACAAPATILAAAISTGYPGGCGWCAATSKSRTPSVKLMASTSSRCPGPATRWTNSASNPMASVAQVQRQVLALARPSTPPPRAAGPRSPSGGAGSTRPDARASGCGTGVSRPPGAGCDR